MLYIKNELQDPYINQAFEEYVFDRFKGEDVLLLWVNKPCVVSGRYQNVFEEIDIARALRENIPVIRRNTGGGTVFHDLGNLNYTIMHQAEDGEMLDYDNFILPMIEALNSIGIPAHKRRSSDIAIDDKKISGSAANVSHGKMLHHGTLLFNTDMSLLHGLLSGAKGNFVSKAIASVRSEVTNIKEYCEIETLEELKEKLLKAFNVTEEKTLSEEDFLQVRKIAESKYMTDEWTYCRGPKFSHTTENGKTEIFVEKGIIIKSNNPELVGMDAKSYFGEML